MIEPELPHNEVLRIQRLLSLHILDTPPEERFDRLTRLAKRLFNVPIALVSLLDVNRQWFKSCQGLPVQETPRNISFCGHTILGDDVFVITNALEDERCFDNPFVTQPPHIRFYAGCPLVVGEDCKIGTLCIIDDKPRTFSDEDRNTLRDLARMVEKEIDAVNLATWDELTQLSNRRGFEALAKQTLNACQLTKTSASLLFFDLDHFKGINDTYGHAEGDKALATFAHELRMAFRENDVIARLCGDEFVVLMPNTTPQSVNKALHTLEKRLRAHQKLDPKGYRIAFSVGKVDYDKGKHPDVAKLLREADQAMYLNKFAPRKKQVA
jgi:diguanylate cyclase (GGDEF)-like protein